MARTKKQTEKPVWLKTTEEELKKIIAELAEKYQPAQVGLILRDQYGIPTTRLFGKKLSAYLKEIGKYNERIELENVQKKLERLEDHLKNNVQDKRTKHKMQITRSRTVTIKKYLD